jgi:hypothetical protein
MEKALGGWTADRIEGAGDRTSDIIQILPISALIPTEEHCARHAGSIRDKILIDQVWTTPVLVLADAMILLDGHHRLAAAKLLDLALIPAFPVRASDTRLSVDAWREGESYSLNDVIDIASEGRLLPQKSTRFRFSEAGPEIAIPLSCLASVDLVLWADRVRSCPERRRVTELT